MWADADAFYSKIPFEKSAGLILVPAVINNVEGKLIFDTAADHILINSKETDSGETVRSSFISLTGESASSEVKLESFVMGAYKAKDIVAFTTDLSKLEKHVGENLLGIFGAGLLDSEYIEIDIKEGVIEIFSSKSLSYKSLKEFQRFPVNFENGIPVIDLQMNGEPMRFVLDTGSSVSIVDLSVVNENKDNFIQSDKRFNLLTAAKESSERYYYFCLGMSIASNRINSLKVAVMDMESVNIHLKEPVKGILSLEDLPFKSIIIDYQKGWVYISQL